MSSHDRKPEYKEQRNCTAVDLVFVYRVLILTGREEMLHDLLLPEE